MNLRPFKLKPGVEPRLSKILTHPVARQTSKKQLLEKLQKDVDAIAKLQYKLSAENRQSLLVILQGMDGSGKDGTIRHIMSGINPQGVFVVSFKQPTDSELQHDYLWRHAQKLPRHGEITIFNRSHYENVLISKIHPELVLNERLPDINSIQKIDEHFWHTRYRQINHFEKNIAQNGTQILKFFLHLSKQEQCRRFLKRIEKKDKHWKFEPEDIKERKFWNGYQQAYEEALKNTSTKIAPWYIVPADDKPYAHFLISRIILAKLKKMNPVLPAVNKKQVKQMKLAKKKLKKEYGGKI